MSAAAVSSSTWNYEVPEDGRVPLAGVKTHDVRGNLAPDAQLAALALEHGLAVRRRLVSVSHP